MKRCKDCKYHKSITGYPWRSEPVWKCRWRQKPTYPEWKTYFSVQRDWDDRGFDCDSYTRKWWKVWRAK